MLSPTIQPGPEPLHVSLVAIPEAVVSTLSGIFDVMNASSMVSVLDRAPLQAPPFRLEIVGQQSGPLQLASRVPVIVERPVAEIAATDIVIVPSVLLGPDGWTKGRYPDLVDWLSTMHDRGALLCSACSGIFLLAETGLFDAADATVHFGYARAFETAFPQVPIHPERVLVVSGKRDELITSGASMTWHDLVLYLIARHAGATAAQTVARTFALQWHQDGLAPYMVFDGRKDHGDVANPGGPGLAGYAFLGRQPAGGDDQAVRAHREDLQTPIYACDRLKPDRIRPAREDRGGQAAAGADGGFRRRNQLAGRLRGTGILPPSLQARNRVGTGGLSPAVRNSRLCADPSQELIKKALLRFHPQPLSELNFTSRLLARKLTPRRTCSNGAHATRR